MYIDEDWKQKRRGDISIKVWSIFIERLCTLMKIGCKKREGTLLSRCDVDYRAIMYTDEDWKQKRRGDISIKVWSIFIERLCTLMKIGCKKREGTLLSRCDVDYRAITYIWRFEAISISNFFCLSSRPNGAHCNDFIYQPDKQNEVNIFLGKSETAPVCRFPF